MMFPSYSTIFKGTMGAWMLILLWLFVFLLALNLYIKQKKIDIPICLTIVLIYVLLQFHMRGYISFLSGWIIVIICALLSIWGAVRVRNALIWQRTHITNISVKQAVDKMPFGVCYYNNQGRVFLINQTMSKLCKEITGETVQNGVRTFEKILNMGQVILLPDDRAISFHSEKCVIDSENVELVTAFDITEEYKKTNILLQREEELRNLNESLITYNKEMVSVIALKEVLNAKVRIHDDLGSSLLATKKYLLQGGNDEERMHLIEALRNNVRFLRQESEEVVYDEYEMIMKTADDIGMNIVISGELPTGEGVSHIAATAMHECLTNTIRHAGGDTLYVDVSEYEDSYRLTFTNNGEVPKLPITPKGGLDSLRNLVEQAGGSMNIAIDDQYKLVLELVKEMD